jgi:hypothetical protein
MEPQLTLLRHDCLDEAPVGLRPGSLVQSVLVALLDGRDVEPLREQFHRLAQEPVPPRADNRLRHVASMQAVADLLGEACDVRLSPAEIDVAIDEVAGEAYLWPSFIDLAMALSLRLGDRGHAKALSLRRLKAPLGEDVPTLTHLLHVASSFEADAQSLPELGYLGAQTALSRTGTARTATTLALAAVHDGKGFAAALRERARQWDAACGGVDRGAAQWAIDPETRTVRLTVTVRGNGSLHECAGWALDDVVYRWPLHVDRLMKREVPLEAIRGAKTRKAVLGAIQKGGIEAVADLQGVTLATDDLAALTARQNAGLAWIRVNHAALAEQIGGIRIPGA